MHQHTDGKKIECAMQEMHFIEQIKTELPIGWGKLTIAGAGSDDQTYTVE